MTQEQMIEAVKQHHPKAPETQIRIWLNEAIKEFSRRTRVVEGAVTFSTVADQRYYSFTSIDSNLFEVEEVWFEDWSIARLQSRPQKRDSV